MLLQKIFESSCSFQIIPHISMSHNLALNSSTDHFNAIQTHSSSRPSFQGKPFSAIWSVRPEARCWQTRWELTSGDVGDINTGISTPRVSLTRDHHHRKMDSYRYRIYWILLWLRQWVWCKLWSWNSNQFGVQARDHSQAPHILTHTLALSTHHPLFPTRWCLGSNSLLYNIRHQNWSGARGCGLFVLYNP